MIRRPTAVLASGLVSGLMVTALTLSLAALVFSGDLAPFLPVGSAFFLLGVVVMNLVAVRSTSLHGAVLMPQDTTSAVMATTVAGAVATLGPSLQFGTAAAVIILGTAATGVAMLLLGGLRAGNLMRFAPYPVMGGFVAGTGWLLVVGAAGFMTDGFAWSTPSVIRLSLGVGLGLALTVILRRQVNVAWFPALILGAVALFYLVVALTPFSTAAAREMGFLGGAGVGFGIPSFALTPIDWSAVVGAVPGLVTVPIVATLGLLLNVSALELVSRRDADLDRELRTAGLANLAGAFTASTAGYHALGPSSLLFRVGAASRSGPLVVAAVALAAVAGGATFVSFLPVPVIGGVLAMLGFSFLADWLVDGRKEMATSEFVLLLTIVAVVASVGFIAGVVLGMAAAVVLFTVKYSRLNPIRATFGGNERSSSIERSPATMRHLADVSHTIRVVELQGFLFFGTADTAAARIAELTTADEIRFLVVDLRRVDGIDSTAVLGLAKLHRRLAPLNLRLVFSHVDAGTQTSLARVGVGPESGVVFTEDIDHALELCEGMLLDEAELASLGPPLLAPDLWERLKPHMDVITLDTGETLADFGVESNSVFIIAEGRIAAELPIDADRWQRVHSAGPGNMLGELSLYRVGGRSARLRAEEPARVYRLSPEAVLALEESDPSCAIAFHRALATVLTERLVQSNDFVRALMR